MEQISIWDFLQSQDNTNQFDSDMEILTDEMLPSLKEELLIESIKEAFGESRGGSTRKPSDEAWEWIISEERKLPFSFNQCCLASGADPEKMLDWLLYYKRKLLS